MDIPQGQADLPWDRYSNVFNAKYTDQTVVVNCQGTRFSVHLGIISSRSEYFRGCFKHPFQEKASSEVTIDHLDPQALGVYFNLAYHFASHPIRTGDRLPSQLLIPISFWYDATLSQIIELHDTCDYLLDTRLTQYIREITYILLGYWRDRSPVIPRPCTFTTFRSFAEAYDLCNGEGREGARELFQKRILETFTSGVTSKEWDSEADTILNHPKFVVEVSKVFICV